MRISSEWGRRKRSCAASTRWGFWKIWPETRWEMRKQDNVRQCYDRYFYLGLQSATVWPKVSTTSSGWGQLCATYFFSGIKWYQHLRMLLYNPIKSYYVSLVLNGKGLFERFERTMKAANQRHSRFKHQSRLKQHGLVSKREIGWGHIFCSEFRRSKDERSTGATEAQAHKRQDSFGECGRKSCSTWIHVIWLGWLRMTKYSNARVGSQHPATFANSSRCRPQRRSVPGTYEAWADAVEALETLSCCSFEPCLQSLQVAFLSFVFLFQPGKFGSELVRCSYRSSSERPSKAWNKIHSARLGFALERVAVRLTSILFYTRDIVLLS